MAKRTRLIISTLTTVLMGLVLFPTSAVAVPQPPHVFYGAVTVGGAAAADGLTVTAAIAGASFPYTPTAQTSGGRYGDDLKFRVPADDPDTGAKEGGVSGDTVVFYVEGVEAGTYSFAVGNVTQLDLSIPALPTLAAPTNVQKTTPDNDNTPTFTWGAVANAASYQVRLDFGTFTDIGNVTTYTFPTSIADGTHTFEVRGVDAQGTPGPSSLYSFTILTQVPAVGVGVGGGGIAGVTSVLYALTEYGRFTEDVIARSADGNAQLYIPKDTIGKNRMGSLLSSISIKEMAEPPAPPAETAIIGPVYNIGPDGATFDPPIELTLKYDPSLLPPGANEKKLVIAWWDKMAKEWVELESSVDPEADTITAKVSHFTAFAILVPTRPASFTLADLKITPTEIYLGESVSISIQLTNTGDLTGSYEVSLKIDDSVVETKEVTLEGGDSETVSFSLTPNKVGEYSVDVGGLQGTFVVKELKAPAAFTTSALTISPKEVDIGERVTISITVTNTGGITGAHKVTLKINGAIVEVREVVLAPRASEKVVFTVVKHAAGTYSVDVDGKRGSFLVREKAPPPKEEKPPLTPPPTTAPPPVTPKPVTRINWWLIGSIIAGVVLIGVVTWRIVTRRRAG
ncbi:MAG TPA: hypothetical protein G4O01_06195 [Dehalococcoidia bacterium]|nr:hypothetical protein [Dehalococcoidia bacterium]